jgi:hypothetical protein
LHLLFIVLMAFDAAETVYAAADLRLPGLGLGIVARANTEFGYATGVEREYFE